MTFKTIHTTHGLARMAQAETTGVQINLTAMAVGDGGGNDTTPSESQTQLVRELFRAAPNRVYQDPVNPALFTAELLIPATVGGFTIREASIIDDQGGMFAVCNTPASYKPLGDGSEGSFGDTVLRMQFLATNASIVTLAIDPNVAIATQQWISNNITVPFLLPGGTTGQVLKKQSNADGDTEWADPTVASVVVTVTEEVQTLAASQTAVILAVCTTQGLAVYVAGSRLLPSQWTPDPVDHTKLTLTASYTAGTQVDFVQNEPGAFVNAPLAQAANLSDLANTATARTNLGVYSKAETDQKAPPSLIGYFAGQTAPQGWLKANGAAISRTAYATLFAQIGGIYGAGDGFNTFNLPDLRGEFLRGWDDSRGVDSGRAFGSFQNQAFISHAHGVSDPTHAHGVSDPGHAHGVSQSPHGHGINDPSHAHGVNDPGHAHAMPGNVAFQGTTFSQEGTNTRLFDLRGNPGTDSRGTGIGIAASGTGVSVQGGNANIGINAAGTGIGISGSGTGVTVQASGGNETRPRNLALLACIKY